MPRAYSVDLRERVMAAVADGCSIAEAAHRFSVRVDAIYDWRRRQQTTGSLAPTTHHCGRPRRVSPEMDRALQAQIDAEPDATLTELQAWLATEHGLVVGRGTVIRAVARLDRPRKESDRHRARS
ncbi:MAG: helix-turn-helix domain-containing protein [Thermomicrobiales bacterium]|nr:helix-turn-helix domain-containing protein [Thermomicrobiales bacterium]